MAKVRLVGCPIRWTGSTVTKASLGVTRDVTTLTSWSRRVMETWHSWKKQDHFLTSCSTVRITDLDKLNLVKICNGGLVLGSSQLLVLPQLPQKK